MTRRALLATLLASLAAAPAARGVDGARDTDFQAPQGYRTLGSGQMSPARGAIAPDGAALFVGTQSSSAIYWARLFATGDPESCAFTPPGSSSVAAAQGLFDGNGRLLVVGTASYAGLGQVIFVARFLYPECALDPTFDGDGYFTFDHEEDVVGVALARTAILLLGVPFERIVVGGNVYPAVGVDLSDILLLQLTPTGQLDDSFGGGDGFLRYDFGNETDVLAALAVDGQRRILLAGTVDLFGDDPDAMVARVLPGGAPDGGFGSLGWTRIVPAADDYAESATALELAPDGSLWTAGVETNSGGSQRVLVREIDAAGSSVFGVGWFFHPDSLRVAGIARQGDGRVVVFGDTDHQDGDRDLFVTACRPTSGTDCLWESAFGPLDEDYLAYPMPDLLAGGDEVAGGLALEAGRPLLFAGAETASGRRGVVARLLNGYIFADGFEGGSAAAW